MLIALKGGVENVFVTITSRKVHVLVTHDNDNDFRMSTHQLRYFTKNISNFLWSVTSNTMRGILYKNDNNILLTTISDQLDTEGLLVSLTFEAKTG